jgi:hypothetical protein
MASIIEHVSRQDLIQKAEISRLREENAALTKKYIATIEEMTRKDENSVAAYELKLKNLRERMSKMYTLTQMATVYGTMRDKHCVAARPMPSSMVLRSKFKKIIDDNYHDYS